jgi:2-amino-4-hydroxy-6-hydroxymethyldihydropteridine diphosphokinase
MTRPAGVTVGVNVGVIVGVGGNVGDPDAIVRRFGDARAALAALGAVRSARLYRSAPLGPAQPAFFNTAVRIALADAQPDELIATLLELEHLLGRRRADEVRWGPRTLDLDVLVWGARQIRMPTLDVPHPRLAERKFALAPLVDLVGEDFAIPGVGPAGAALARVAAQDCEDVGAW